MQRNASTIHEGIEALSELFLTLHAGAVETWLEAELTFAQLKALMMLAHHQSLTLSQLAKRLGIGNSAASILVQQLVGLQLVTRQADASDRRRTLLRLTAQAHDVVAGRREKHLARLRRCLTQMSDADRASLVRGIKALVTVVRADMESAQETPVAFARRERA